MNSATTRILVVASGLVLLLGFCGCMERFTQKKASDPHAGETAAEHAAHDHAGETAEEHAAHAHDGESAEEHADHGHEGEEHHEGGGHDHSEDGEGAGDSGGTVK